MTVKTNLLRLLLLTVIITACLVAITRTPRFLKFYYPYHYRQIIELNAKEFELTRCCGSHNSYGKSFSRCRFLGCFRFNADYAETALDC